MSSIPNILHQTPMLSQQWNKIWWDSHGDKYRGPSKQGKYTVI